MICGQPLIGGQVVTQNEKGVKGLQKACSSRDDDKRFFVGQIVHKSCRHSYCNIKLIKRDLKRKRDEGTEPGVHSTVLRSRKAKFDFANDCLFCWLPAKDDRNKGPAAIYQIRTFNCQEKLAQACSQRGPDDKWAETERNRIEFAQDLHAADAWYHSQCNINFRTNKSIPLTFRRSIEMQTAAG